MSSPQSSKKVVIGAVAICCALAVLGYFALQPGDGSDVVGAEPQALTPVAPSEEPEIAATSEQAAAPAHDPVEEPSAAEEASTSATAP